MVQVREEGPLYLSCKEDAVLSSLFPLSNNQYNKSVFSIKRIKPSIEIQNAGNNRL